MVTSNLDKVVQHGQRADSIVKNMLAAFARRLGERSSVKVNAMVEEALNLAYHGRARGEARLQRDDRQIARPRTPAPPTFTRAGGDPRAAELDFERILRDDEAPAGARRTGLTNPRSSPRPGIWATASRSPFATMGPE